MCRAVFLFNPLRIRRVGFLWLPPWLGTMAIAAAARAAAAAAATSQAIHRRRRAGRCRGRSRAASASATARAVGGLWSGALASSFRTNSAAAAGRAGLRLRGDGGACSVTASIVSNSLALLKGDAPVQSR